MKAQSGRTGKAGSQRRLYNEASMAKIRGTKAKNPRKAAAKKKK